MTSPLFSIVTVSLNHLGGLTKTHHSLNTQTCTDYEWIVIDGCSTDGTTAYLEGTDINWISEKDNGIYDAMNKGIDHANGTYIIFMNAGDCFADNKVLETIRKKIRNSIPDFIYGDALEIYNGKIFLKKSRDVRKIIQGMITHHQSMIYKTDLLKKEKYNLSYKIAADYDLTLRILRKAENILYIPQPICIFESGGLSQRQAFQGRKEQFQIRRAVNIPLRKNIFIFVGQTFLYCLRRLFPGFYWFLKRY